MRRLTITDTASQVQRFNLGSQSIVVEVNFNTFVNGWFIDVSVNDVSRVSGRRVHQGVNIVPELAGFALVCRDTSDNDADIDYDALVSGSAFIYVIEPSDLA